MIRKIKLVLKFMSQPEKQTVARHILPNTSRSKGNQTMKSGLLIEYIMRNIFLEKFFVLKIAHMKGSETSLLASFFI